MEKNNLTFWALAAKSIVVHTITYMFMGILAYTLLNYKEAFASPELACWMRPTSDPLVMAGPLFQPIRGLIFALAFYPLREIVFLKKNGWLIIGWLLIALGILSTFGPAPGSVEGMVYTILPVSYRTYIEVVPQALLFSGILFYWVVNPDKKWINWVLGVAFCIIILMPVLGLLVKY